MLTKDLRLVGREWHETDFWPHYRPTQCVLVTIPTPSPHERNPCSSALAFQTSYAQHYIMHSSKRPSHGRPCNKVIHRCQRFSGVERSSVSDSAASQFLRCRVSVYNFRAASCSFIREGLTSRHVRRVYDLQIIMKPITAVLPLCSLDLSPSLRLLPQYYCGCHYCVVL